MDLYESGSVDWFYDGWKTEEEMRSDKRFSQLFSEPCVLYDNREGKVYRFEPLSDVASRCAVSSTGEPSAVFKNVMAVLDGTYQAPGVAEAKEVADEAKATADEAKATAGTAAASVNEYMDALLGLDATDETGATDAE